MKKLIASVLSGAMIFACSSSLAAIDLTGMTFDELVELREQINLAIWNCQEWQEVTVPAGIWKVGEDIPAGHWTIKVAAERDYLYVSYFNILDDAGLGVGKGAYLFQQDIATPGYSGFGEITPESVDIDMKEGWYVKFRAPVIFTPYTGKPDLGFK